MKTLNAYCTSILHLITLILSKYLDLVFIKKHSKFHYKQTEALCVITYQSLLKSSSLLNVQTLCARNERIYYLIKLTFCIQVALVCLNNCVKFQYKKLKYLCTILLQNWKKSWKMLYFVILLILGQFGRVPTSWTYKFVTSKLA